MVRILALDSGVCSGRRTPFTRPERAAANFSRDPVLFGLKNGHLPEIETWPCSRHELFDNVMVVGYPHRKGTTNGEPNLQG
jgi:hypothetical protein